MKNLRTVKSEVLPPNQFSKLFEFENYGENIVDRNTVLLCPQEKHESLLILYLFLEPGDYGICKNSLKKTCREWSIPAWCCTIRWKGADPAAPDSPRTDFPVPVRAPTVCLSLYESSLHQFIAHKEKTK